MQVPEQKVIYRTESQVLPAPLLEEEILGPAATPSKALRGLETTNQEADQI